LLTTVNSMFSTTEYYKALQMPNTTKTTHDKP